MKSFVKTGSRFWRVLRLLPHLPNFARLFWGLFRDARVPLRLKAMVVATVLYVLSPIDLMSDFIPILGQTDDLMLLVLSGHYFLRWSPQAVVAEHVARIDAGSTAKFRP